MDLGSRELIPLLRGRWRLDAGDVRGLDAGFGGRHWVAADASGRRWFVTVNELDDERWAAVGDPDAAFAALRATMDTAAGLVNDAGLDFVVAPFPTGDGVSVVRGSPRHAVIVFPFVEGAAGDFGDVRDADERAAVVRLLAELHRATPLVRGAVPVHDVMPAGRARFEEIAFQDDRSWGEGPFAGPARDLLVRHRPPLRDALARFDELAKAPAAPPVITHGEPHPGNVLRAGDRLLLIDWDTVALAPPERDLWMVVSQDEADVCADVTGHAVSADALTLYRLRWYLDDIMVYTRLFRSPHRRTPVVEESWDALTETFDLLTALERRRR